MNDWLTRVSAASGIPSEIFILGFMAFFLLIFLAIGIIYCLIRLRSISANTLQTIAQARMAWREDLGAAVTQSKDLIADRMKPEFHRDGTHAGTLLSGGFGRNPKRNLCKSQSCAGHA